MPQFADAVIHPVILSGGSGTRLWPMSTPARPKQLLALTGAETMLQMTARRTAGHARFADPLVVGSAAHADEIAAQLAAVTGTHRLICEPCARNTAPAIALAAEWLAKDDPAALMLVVPSDHVIADVAAFHAAIERALPLVADGWLVTFGIEPTGPETGYGYIAAAEELAPGVLRAARFIEKPPRDMAEAMLAAGGHSWNAGIFLFRVDRFLEELAHFQPAMHAAAHDAIDAAEEQGHAIHPAHTAFAASPSDSIDYAVMEKADRVAVVPVAMGWSDLGSWEALHSLAERDATENSLCDGALAIDSHGCLVRSDGPRVSLLGVRDLVVIVTGGEVVILPRSNAQRVRELAAARSPKD